MTLKKAQQMKQRNGKVLTMKLQFDSHQDFQIQAIQSVVGIFEGQPLNTGDYEFSLQQADTSLAFTENGVGNVIRLTEQEILKNVRAV